MNDAESRPRSATTPCAAADWKLGERHSPTHGERIRDPFGFHNGKAHHDSGRAAMAGQRHGSEAAARRSACDQALAVFDIEPPFTVVR